MQPHKKNNIMSYHSLPQPLPTGDCIGQDKRQYKYITHDQFEVDWLGSAERLQRYLDESYLNDDSKSTMTRYAPGTLVWVLQSKGRQHSNFNTEAECTSYMLHKKRRDKKHQRAMKKTMSNGNAPNELETAEIVDGTNATENTERPKSREYGYHSKSEWFQRARVVSDEDSLEDGVSFEERMQRRVKVRYSRGSTYRVRAFNLVPVVEKSLQDVNRSDGFTLPPLVIVTPETHIYRRIARAHTTPDDSFMEIGCDYGITVDKIRKAMEDAGDVPRVWPIEDGINDTPKEAKCSCLGIDRSQESIGIANERFPECKFMLCNILNPDDIASLNTFCQQTLEGGAPSVIAIDINGNRDVDGVLECLQVVMNEKWTEQPRLIVVKSRFLYWDLRKLKE